MLSNGASSAWCVEWRMKRWGLRHARCMARSPGPAGRAAPHTPCKPAACKILTKGMITITIDYITIIIISPAWKHRIITIYS